MSDRRQDRPVEALLRVWNSVLGDAVPGGDGANPEDAYWIPLALSILETTFDRASTVPEAGLATRAVATPLAAVGLLDVDELAGANQRSNTQVVNLMVAIMERQEVPPDIAEQASLALVRAASQWCTGMRGAVRPMARAAALAARDRLAQIVATGEPGVDRELKMAAERWAALILGIPEWSDSATEFMVKFGLSTGDLESASDQLDLTVRRTDALVRFFMDAYCNGCDPHTRPVCVEQAGNAGIQVLCPLLASDGRRPSESQGEP